MVIIIRIILLYIVFYLLLRLVTTLLRKGRMYYQAWRQVQQKRNARPVRPPTENLNLRAFDVEDAQYEEIKPGNGDKK
ncbi:hypothetical protein LLH00_11455 [bacterium]|nr:hypothetical protein [bacterium]